MRTKKLISFVLLSALLISSCSKSSESASQSENQSSSNPADNNPSNSGNTSSGIYDFPEITIIDLSSDSEWDYIVMGLSDYYYLNLNSSNNFVQSVLLHSDELKEDFLLNFNENGPLWESMAPFASTNVMAVPITMC